MKKAQKLRLEIDECTRQYENMKFTSVYTGLKPLMKRILKLLHELQKRLDREE